LYVWDSSTDCGAWKKTSTAIGPRSFLISSILLNPNPFLMSFALGAPVAFLRLALCGIAGILAGALTQIFFRNKSIFNFEKFLTDTVCKKRLTFEI